VQFWSPIFGKQICTLSENSFASFCAPTFVESPA
jgi:hypothetical protein